LIAPKRAAFHGTAVAHSTHRTERKDKQDNQNLGQHQGCELPRTERFAEDQQLSEVTRFAQLDEIPALLGLMIVAYIVSSLCSLT